ncbi:MAG: exo-alpha-sialidase, partial [Actinomycetota bacterium]|nr:exo-alpha-sialidase [Actinomycetota bacterium]
LGSGHPDLRDLQDDVPPLLGLIVSTDGGRRWQSVSLLGRADFHVLRAAGDRVYGVNATNGQFLASEDGGRTWKRRSPPAPVIDLAPNANRPAEVVASTEDGMHVSRDGGATWRPLTPGVGGLLARTRGGTLFVVDAEDGVHRSDDGGASFDAAGEIGGQPAAFAAHGDDLYVALHSNEVKTSSDGGRTWRLRVAPS